MAALWLVAASLGSCRNIGSCLFERVNFSKYYKWKSTPQQPMLESENVRGSSFAWRWYIGRWVFRSVTMHAFDRQMDGQNSYSRTLRIVTMQSHARSCNEINTLRATESFYRAPEQAISPWVTCQWVKLVTFMVISGCTLSQAQANLVVLEGYEIKSLQVWFTARCAECVQTAACEIISC